MSLSKMISSQIQLHLLAGSGSSSSSGTVCRGLFTTSTTRKFCHGLFSMRYVELNHLFRSGNLSTASAPQTFKYHGLSRRYQTLTTSNLSTHQLTSTDQQQSHNSRYRNNIKLYMATLVGFMIALGTVYDGDNITVNAREAQSKDQERVNLLLQACKQNDIEAIRKLIKDGVGKPYKPYILIAQRIFVNSLLCMHWQEFFL